VEAGADIRFPASTPAVGAPRRIAMLMYPGIAPLDVTGPLQVFGLANFLAKQRLYDIVTVAPSAAPVPTVLGFSLLPACAMSDLPMPIDTLLVSGGGAPGTLTDPAVFAWLRGMATKARRYGSICTGAFVLAEAGLIDGKRVTTHWAYGDELAHRYPAARVDSDAIFIRDGRLCSSAGITAGMDLALALVEEDHGRALALAVARYLVLFLKRAGGQTQFSSELQTQFSTMPAIEKVQRWCLENLSADLDVNVLAARAGMSVRNFGRLFRDSAACTPAEFVLNARLRVARRTLEETQVSLKEVAQQCGFKTASALRRVFLRELGLSAAAYRGRSAQTAAGVAMEEAVP
jgi:transcriptional regulator GlxA family with amidase domain